MSIARTDRRLSALVVGLLAACGRSEMADDEALAFKAAPGLVERVSRGGAIVLVDLDESAEPATAGTKPVERRSLLKERLTRGLGGQRLTLERDFRQLPVVALRVEGLPALRALAQRPEVDRLHPVPQLHPLGNANLSLIRRERAVAAVGPQLQGEGTFVAVIDSGLDFEGPTGTTAAAAAMRQARKDAFGTCARETPDADGRGFTVAGQDCRVAYMREFANQDGSLDDGDRHGTNVAGIVAQVAPKTRLIGLDIFNMTATGRSGDGLAALAAIDWATAERRAYNEDASLGRNIVALNMSFGSDRSSAPCPNDFFASSIRAAREVGILSAAASGNGGSKNTLSAPSCVPEAISVGAVLDVSANPLTRYVEANCKDSSTAADVPACFSNTAGFLTLLAPGVGITAAGITMSGTSQATPHVSGAIAALAGSLPERRDTDGWAAANASVVRDRLTRGAPSVMDGRLNKAFPRLDLLSAGTGASASGTTWTGRINQTITATVGFGASGYAPGLGGYAASTGSGTGAFNAASWTPLDGRSGVVAGEGLPVAVKVPAKTPSGAVLPVTVALKAADSEERLYARGAEVRVDLAGPVAGRLTVTGTGTSRELSLSWIGFADPLSGIARYRLFTAPAANRGPRKCTDNTPAVLAELPGDRTSYVHAGTVDDGVVQSFFICAVDAVGNGSAVVAAAGFSKPHANAPMGSASIGGNGYLRRRTDTLVIEADDESDTAVDSAVDFYCVSLASAASCPNWVGLTSRAKPLAVSPFTVTATFPDGPVAVWLKDKWGNVGRVGSLFPTNATVDATGPIEGALAATRDSVDTPPVFDAARLFLVFGTTGKPTTDWRDATTGIATIRVAYGAQTTPPVSCPDSFAHIDIPISGGTTASLGGGIRSPALPMAAGTKYFLRVCAIDAYGNTSKGKPLTVQ